jgi:hypothetical protein
MFALENVVPWGRSFDEYRRMFALSDDDLRRRLVGCADGPASFNAELTARGGRVVSCDPLYAFDTQQIRQRIDETCQTVIDQTRQNEEQFVWTGLIRSIEELERTRLSAMDAFLADYGSGRRQKRYVAAQMPSLPFPDADFDIALCSHFLFLYSEHLTKDFHLKSICEMCRVATECRVFPLLDLAGTKSRHLDPAVTRLRSEGMTVSIERVDYEFQRGGNEMLRVVGPTAGSRHEEP